MFAESTLQEGNSSRLEPDIDSQNQYRHLFMQAQVAIGILRGPKFIIELANTPLLRIWGKGSEVLGKPLLEGLPEVTNTPYPKLLQQVLAEGITHYAQENAAALVRNGMTEQVYFNFVYQPLYEANRTISGVMIIAHEVTEQVEARKKIAESERRFRNLVEEAEVATAIYLGREMKIELANEAMIRLWGKDRSVIGKTIRKALPELDGQPFHQLLDQVFTTGKTYRATEDRADLVVDGQLKTYYFNFSYKPLRNASGEIYAILNMATDVTELVAAKQALAHNSNRLRLAADMAGLGTWDYHVGADHITWDDRCREFYGIAPGMTSPVISNNSMIHPDDRDRVLQQFDQALQPGSNGSFFEEYRIIRQGDGAIRHLRSKAQTFFHADGSPVHISGTLQDITDQQLKATLLKEKVAEQTAELNTVVAQLRQSNQELEQFAHVASHDLKEPIRKIKLFAGLLVQECQCDLSATSLRYLRKIEHAAHRMNMMVEGVLHYATINPRPEPFTTILLAEVFQQIEQDLELPIMEKGARLEYSEVPPFTGAPLLMYQLFYNLVNNALKFARKEVPPHITLNWQLPQSENQVENTLVLQLRDNGIGFEPGASEYIFQTFSRLHPKDAYEGTGLGLAMCRKIVTRHGGTIHATGKPGEGACFTITLPRFYRN